MYDALIIGSGPNGLSAAVRLAQAGLSVLVLEGADTAGGGTRSGEVTLPGFVHDICAAIHPLSLASPYLSRLPLADFGLEWVHPEIPVVHALSKTQPISLFQDLDSTAEHLGGRDGRAYRRLMRPFVDQYAGLMEDFLGPFPFPPRHPVTMMRFGPVALQSASGLSRRTFRSEEARALFGGLAAHAMMPLEWTSMAGFGMMLGVLAHAVGWPMARGGSQKIADAMIAYLESLGGEVRTGTWIRSMADLPPARFVLFDTSVKGMLEIAGEAVQPAYARALAKYRYGMGVCKVDFALSEPIPWARPEYGRAATVHLGGPLAEIELSEREIWHGRISDRPYVLLVQQSAFDPTRAPEGKHTAWAYCHVPKGSDVDYSDLITGRIEEFAPGFRETVLAQSTRTATDYAAYNPNYVGGDINGGVQNLRQLFTRPAVRWNPYRVPVGDAQQKLYLCSSVTPPGGGVHGMCGFYAAETVLKDAGI